MQARTLAPADLKVEAASPAGASSSRAARHRPLGGRALRAEARVALTAAAAEGHAGRGAARLEADVTVDPDAVEARWPTPPKPSAASTVWSTPRARQHRLGRPGEPGDQARAGGEPSPAASSSAAPACRSCAGRRRHHRQLRVGPGPGAFKQRSAYAASKAGVISLTRSLAMEWAPQARQHRLPRRGRHAHGARRLQPRGIARAGRPALRAGPNRRAARDRAGRALHLSSAESSSSPASCWRSTAGAATTEPDGPRRPR